MDLPFMRKKDPRDMSEQERQHALAKTLTRRQIQLSRPEMTPDEADQTRRQIQRMKA